jgi:hypothetical protein
MLVPLLAAMAAIPAVVYLRTPAQSFATPAHSAIVNESVSQASQAAAPVVRPEKQPAASSAATPAIRAAPQPTAPPEPAISSPRPADDLTVVLTARAVCWIGATLDGKRKFERLMQRGEEATLHAREEMVLRVGNAGALSLTINGLATVPLGRQGEAITARINLANYKRFIEPSQRPDRAGAT